MIVHFQFTLDDYRNAFRAHYRKGASAFTRWMMKLVLVIGVLLLLTGVLLFIAGQSNLNVVLPPLLLGAIWTWIGMGKTYQLSARSQFVKNPALREPRRVEFNDDGVTTDAGIASSQVSWKAYLRYVESSDTFLLYTSPAGCRRLCLFHPPRYKWVPRPFAKQRAGNRWCVRQILSFSLSVCASRWPSAERNCVFFLLDAAMNGLSSTPPWIELSKVSDRGIWMPGCRLRRVPWNNPDSAQSAPWGFP